ncbi:MAG: N-glycosylase/DNA lyase [Cetobacterium sp.]|uniref:N-glycosylase/DNA lyase n=3 Tax=Fusobacteriaceae TaxID=203492 RepID=UPI001F06339C|nr:MULTISPECIES: N-glycosylase/DNA lyase [Cetobacterium]MCX3068308.1 N-glycosylase/DNA lyase [Cetobacterium somerae]UPO97010.1 N-glycosylase/DNA lyase [Cetobacterium somerae]
MKNAYFYEVQKIYENIRSRIEERLDEYRKIWRDGDNKDIFCELAFCILTPQSKARNAWKAISELRDNNLLFTGSEEEMLPFLNIVRFNRTKAKNLYILRKQMTDENGKFITKDFFSTFNSAFEMREWIVKNIRGMSYKEASHFLRNIGFGQELAILDRHILKNLAALDVIKEVPKTVTPKLYKEIEEKLKEYCKEIDIPMENIDLLLWYLEAKDIFK